MPSYLYVARIHKLFVKMGRKTEIQQSTIITTTTTTTTTTATAAPTAQIKKEN